ncbi:MAG: thioredoxin family protein [Candidatus Bathyarchaeota archaeon]
MKEIESENDLNAILKTGGSFFVLFYASWCPYSRRFLPIFESYAKKKGYGNFLRVRLDDDDNSCWEKYEVKEIPTVMFFAEGKLTRRLNSIPGEGISERHMKDFLNII